MMNRFIALAALSFVAPSVHGGELAALDAESVDLGSFHGVVYYTVEKDGYRVVATLASGAEAQPIRFVSTLGPGQHMRISVPQAFGQPSVDFEITRDGESLLVSDPLAAPIVDPSQKAAVEEVVRR